MRGRRVVAEKKPGDRPHAAEHTEHVEDGRPAACKAVVAQNSREEHPDNCSNRVTDEQYTYNERSMLGHRPAGNQGIDSWEHDTFTESR